MPKHLEFKVTILSGEAADTYSVLADAGEYRALSTLHWRDVASLSAPPGPDTTDDSRAIGRPHPEPSRPKPNYKAMGEQLGAALFKGDVRAAWDKLTGSTTPTAFIRLRLEMDLRRPGMARVAGLPWELLRLEGGEALAISPRTPLVRSLIAGTRKPPTPHDGPIRVLVMTSNPTGVEPLQLRQECERLQETLGDNPDVEVQLTFLHADRGVSLRNRLLTALESAQERPYHVLHFMGHGGFHEGQGGALVFDDGRGGADLVSGEALAGMLAGSLESLRLVVLNACDTGKAAAGSDMSPLSGVATALVQRGVAAVVAMQQPISDRSALQFSEHFYSRMAAPGRAIDVAVAEARKRLSYGGAGGGGGEWATPVIYLQPTDGVVFPAPEGHTVAPDRGGAGDVRTVFLATPSLSLGGLHQRLKEALGTALTRHRVEYSDRRRAPDADTRAKIRSADLCVHLLSDTRAEGEPAAPGESAAVLELKAVRAMGRPQLVIRPTNANEPGVVSERYANVLEKLAQADRDHEDEFEFWQMDQNEVVAAIREKLEGRSSAGTANAPAGSAPNVRVDAFRTDLQLARKVEDVAVGQNVNVARNTSVDGTPDATCESIAQSLYIVVAGTADAEWVKQRVNAARRSRAQPHGPRYVGVYNCRDGDAPELQAKDDYTDDDPAAAQLVRGLRKGLS